MSNEAFERTPGKTDAPRRLLCWKELVCPPRFKPRWRWLLRSMIVGALTAVFVGVALARALAEPPGPAGNSEAVVWMVLLLGAVFGGVVGPWLGGTFTLAKERIAWEGQRRNELNRAENRCQSIIESLHEIDVSLPARLKVVEKALEYAHSEYRNSAFGVMYNCVEKAVGELRGVQALIKHIASLG